MKFIFPSVSLKWVTDCQNIVLIYGITLLFNPCICLFGCFSLFVFAFTAICPHCQKATRQDGVRLRVCFGVYHSTECSVSSLSHTSWLSARASRHEQPSWGRPTTPLTTTTTPHKEKGRSGLEGRRGGEQKMERWWWVGGCWAGWSC